MPVAIHRQNYFDQPLAEQAYSLKSARFYKYLASRFHFFGIEFYAVCELCNLFVGASGVGGLPISSQKKKLFRGVWQAYAMPMLRAFREEQRGKSREGGAGREEQGGRSREGGAGSKEQGGRNREGGAGREEQGGRSREGGEEQGGRSREGETRAQKIRAQE